MQSDHSEVAVAGTRGALPEEETVTPDPVCVHGSASGLVPVTAVGGPGRNPVDANVGLHTQYGLVLQLGRHLGSALRATGGGAKGRGRGRGGKLGSAQRPLTPLPREVSLVPEINFRKCELGKPY